MTTIDHPRFTQKSYGGKDFRTTLTTFDHVSTSPAKQKFTFANSKSIRFKQAKVQHDLIGYNLPPTKSSRAAGFGFGKRFVE